MYRISKKFFIFLDMMNGNEVQIKVICGILLRFETH